jgi:nitroreductase
MNKKTIQLLPPSPDAGKSTMETFSGRRSIRSISDENLSLQDLSNLLWAASGVNSDQGLLTVPIMWEMPLYAAMEDGVYLYIPEKHELQQISDKDLRADIPTQDFAGNAPVQLLLSQDDSKVSGSMRSMIKDTGGIPFYAGLHMGYLSQSIYLAASGLGLNTVALGWFDKDLLAKELKSASDQEVFLVHPVGYPQNHIPPAWPMV